jgi:hypothetical protein
VFVLFCLVEAIAVDDEPSKAFYQLSKGFILSELNSELKEHKDTFAMHFKPISLFLPHAILVLSATWGSSLLRCFAVRGIEAATC